MSRELIVQVIAIKKNLYQELEELKRQISVIEAKKSDVQIKLNRVEQFGLRHAKSEDVPCIFCFVYHDVLSSMESIPSKILGTSLYKCQQCGRELKVHP